MHIQLVDRVERTHSSQTQMGNLKSRNLQIPLRYGNWLIVKRGVRWESMDCSGTGFTLFLNKAHSKTPYPKHTLQGFKRMESFKDIISPKAASGPPVKEHVTFPGELHSPTFNMCTSTTCDVWRQEGENTFPLQSRELLLEGSCVLNVLIHRNWHPSTSLFKSPLSGIA